MSFDAIAPWYRALEAIAFGGVLQRSRVACLPEIGSPHRALIVGEGNGRFLAELLRLHPNVEVDCADASQRMLELAQERIGRRSPAESRRVRFLQRDVMSWTPPTTEYDLIVTHFLLDCFPKDRVADVVKRLSRSAPAQATWLLADFCIPAGGFARWRARVWLAAMYRFFQVTAGIEASELVDPSPFLRAAGFTLASQHLFRSGMIKSELWRRSLPGSAGG